MVPATGTGATLGAVTEAGLGGENAPLGPGVSVTSGFAAASVVSGAAAGIFDSSIGF